MNGNFIIKYKMLNCSSWCIFILNKAHMKVLPLLLSTEHYQLIWAGVQSHKNYILLTPSSLSYDLLCVNKLYQELHMTSK